MAVKEITPSVLTKFNTFDLDALTMAAATTAADGFLIDADYQDHKLLLAFSNTDQTTAYDITIKKGNGLQGVKDLTVEIAATKTAVVVVESGAFKDVSGDNKGKIVAIPENAAVKMTAVVLP